MKKTKIICTIGPASDSLTTLSQLLEAGMDIMRLNFSHGCHAEHSQRIATAREAARAVQKPLAIMLDTKGPEIRTRQLKDGKPVLLQANSPFIITSRQEVKGDEHQVAVTYPNLVNELVVGDTILIDDGLIELIVEQIDQQQLYCRVKNTGLLGEYKGVNLPNVSTQLPALSAQDKADLIFGCQQQVDFIAASFIRKRADIDEIRQFLDANGGQQIAIIAKIENQEGLDNFSAILAAADGIMVARGDLGVEIPIEEVIIAQKMMAKHCNQQAKPVIIATQMLESMTVNPRPTRAEAGDVANAILDGADALMLSGETAKGRYPVETVRTMVKICQKTDSLCNGDADYLTEPASLNDAISHSAVITAERLSKSLIAVISDCGAQARSIRQYRPAAHIIAVTSKPSVFNQLLLVRGVYPYLMASPISAEAFLAHYRTSVASDLLTYTPEAQLLIVDNGQLTY